MGGRGGSLGSKSKSGGGGGKSFDSKNSFFGNVHMESGSYFTPQSQVSADGKEVTIITNNVTTVKGNPVLIVGDNQAVYLKDWNIAGVGVKDKAGNYKGDAVAVKVKEQYYKPYTFKNKISEDVSIGKTLTFNDLKNTAKAQEKAQNQYSPFQVIIGRSGISKSKTGSKLGV